MKKIFNHRLFLTPLASYVGFAALVYAVYALAAGTASPLWLLLLVPATFLILMGITVGFHRLFCHVSFKTSSFWHIVLAYLGTLGVYGSSVQWAAMHASHHKWADGPQDPHYTGWRYLFWKKNRPTVFQRKVLTRLYRNPVHRFFHRYYILVIAATAAVLLAISPWALLFGYLAPMGWLHFVGSAHQVFAHGKNGAQTKRWAELLLFTGGEWLHEHHHAKPRDIRFGSLDAGYWFIRAIRSTSQTVS